MEMAKLQILLPYKLDNYSDIKRFIDIVKQLFPEQTSNGRVYPYSKTSNYQFSLHGDLLGKTYYGTTEFLNVIYKQKHISLASASIYNFEKQVTLVSVDGSTIILCANDIAVLEEFETKIRELLGANPEKKRQQEVLQTPPFLAKDFGDFALPTGLFDEQFKTVINNRISEIQKAVTHEMPLSAIIMLGSTLEGSLCMVATKYPHKFNVAVSAPKNKEGNVLPLGNWTLTNLIEVAYDIGVLEKDVKEFSKVVRDFRNYIHPNEQVKQKFSPTMGTVRIACQVLKAALNQISVFVKRNIGSS